MSTWPRSDARISGVLPCCERTTAAKTTSLVVDNDVHQWNTAQPRLPALPRPLWRAPYRKRVDLLLLSATLMSAPSVAAAVPLIVPPGQDLKLVRSRAHLCWPHLVHRRSCVQQPADFCSVSACAGSCQGEMQLVLSRGSSGHAPWLRGDEWGPGKTERATVGRSCLRKWAAQLPRITAQAAMQSSRSCKTCSRRAGIGEQVAEPWTLRGKARPADTNARARGVAETESTEDNRLGLPV